MKLYECRRELELRETTRAASLRCLVFRVDGNTQTGESFLDSEDTVTYVNI